MNDETVRSFTQPRLVDYPRYRVSHRGPGRCLSLAQAEAKHSREGPQIIFSVLIDVGILPSELVLLRRSDHHWPSIPTNRTRPRR